MKDNPVTFWKLTSHGVENSVRCAKLPLLTVFIQVDDIDAKVKLVEEKGSFILNPLRNPRTVQGFPCSTNR